MTKLTNALIGVSMLALSGNATAMMIQDKTGEHLVDISDIPLLLTDFAERMDVFANHATTKGDRKHVRKGGKLLNRAEKRHLKLTLLDGSNERKWQKREGKLGKVLAKMDLNYALLDEGDVPDDVPHDIPGDTPGDIPGDTPGDTPDSVPEPTTIALLGLGLLGIGAARRLRKTV